ncbi:aspartate--tRNA ligase [Candidatus Sumerlaeota bacterium]|nr:aspartate--tRNA ligase [Candidatus Sumerlaeota bacterium]
MEQGLTYQRRTHYCNEPRAEHIGQELLVKGWVHFRRDHGGLIFIDLRDRTGLLQIVFDPEAMEPEQFAKAHDVRAEYVLAVCGTLRERPAGMLNSKMDTGDVELLITRFEILNQSKPTPFKLDDHHGKVGEDIRLKYRYLDLRRPEIQKNIIMRSQLMKVSRDYLHAQGFLDIDTPILTKSTPEGARDFLVPSRMEEGAFYALPQSPQLFKQSLMIAGYDKYYQIARCFRDEDFRANRQPEFTQIDIEMSFITPEDMYVVIEGLMASIFSELKGVEIPTPFRRMSYADAMLKYGSDKPDLRFGMEIHDVTDVFREGCEFQVFKALLEKPGNVIRALCVTGGAEKYSNTQLKPGGELPEYAAIYGAKGLAWFKVGADGPDSTIKKFFADATLQNLQGALEAKEGDLILIVAGAEQMAAEALGALRLKLGKDLGMIDPDALEFTWIENFPLVNWNANEKRWDPTHHPFTAPRAEDLPLLDTDPGKALSWAYDLALNGEEIGGGSIRIHQPEVQRKCFEMIGIGPEEAERKFGFLLDALSYGAPPHGGIAMGLDRILMIILGVHSIREVIPFPKTQTGACLMTEAPSPVDPTQLRDLRLRIVERQKA